MRYIAKRLGLFLVTLWAALTINFLLPRLMPGNEATAVYAQFRNANPAILHALQVEFGVNDHQNVLLSYFQYLGNCFTGQFGLTAATRTPGHHGDPAEPSLDDRAGGGQHGHLLRAGHRRSAS